MSADDGGAAWVASLPDRRHWTDYLDDAWDAQKEGGIRLELDDPDGGRERECMDAAGVMVVYVGQDETASQALEAWAADPQAPVPLPEPNRRGVRTRSKAMTPGPKRTRVVADELATAEWIAGLVNVALRDARLHAVQPGAASSGKATRSARAVWRALYGVDDIPADFEPRLAGRRSHSRQVIASRKSRITFASAVTFVLALIDAWKAGRPDS